MPAAALTRRATAALALLLVAACTSSSAPPAAAPSPSATASAQPSASPTATPTPAPTPSGRPGPGRHDAVLREGDPRLPGHTVLHPAGDVPFLLPVVVWGNGGCRTTNEEYHVFLTGLASQGFLVIANGAPDKPFFHGDTEKAVLRPHLLTEAIDWAVTENSRAGSRFQGRIDTRRIAVMGQSCGAAEALTASSDPRVRTTVAWNDGGSTTGLHAPVLFVSGGPGDETYDETRQAYAQVKVPAVHADNPAVGHVGLWDDPAHRPAALRIAERWLAFILYADPHARAYFDGPRCGLCTAPGWTVQSRNGG